MAILFKLLNWRQHKNLMCLLGCFSSVLYFAFPHTYSAFHSTVSARDLQNSLILNSYECGCMHWNLDDIFTARTKQLYTYCRIFQTFVFSFCPSFQLQSRCQTFASSFSLSFQLQNHCQTSASSFSPSFLIPSRHHLKRI